MKIGVLTAPWGDQPLLKVLDLVKDLGVRAVEIGTGNYPGNGHCDPELLLRNVGARETFAGIIADRRLELTALSCHGNPLHPDGDIRVAHHAVWRQTVQLAKEIGVTRVITFSGCPGDPGGGGVTPIWVTAPWPPEHADLLAKQWRDAIIPYWKEEAAFADSLGVDVCFEMHPNMAVYNPETLNMLRVAAGPRICCNFDPSHLWWQQMDPVEVVYALGDVIKHVHAKDVQLNARNVALNGVLDAKHYSEVGARAHVFRTLGYGHGEQDWKNIVTALRRVGYDGVLSIEHEDGEMSAREGLTRAIGLLQGCMIHEAPGPMTWA
jgi:sugar phosphate isomerase/epimerase